MSLEKPETRVVSTGSPADSGRRRFVKAGLAVAPLVVTLTARPVWAQDVANGTLGAYGPNSDIGTTGQAPVVYGEPALAPDPSTVTETADPLASGGS